MALGFEKKPRSLLRGSSSEDSENSDKEILEYNGGIIHDFCVFFLRHGLYVLIFWIICAVCGAYVGDCAIYYF